MMMKPWIICLLLVLTVGVSHAQVIIITNKSVNEAKLTKAEIQKIFLGKENQWPDNTKIHVVNLKNEEVHKAFLEEYIGRSATQYKNWWKKMLFTGKGEPPEEFDSVEALVEFVSKTKGAIGYIDTSPENENVKEITVE